MRGVQRGEAPSPTLGQAKGGGLGVSPRYNFPPFSEEWWSAALAKLFFISLPGITRLTASKVEENEA